MPGGSEKASEFKRYQQALAIAYAVVIGAGTLLLAASVVRVLLFRPVVQPSDPLTPDLIQRCNDQVTALHEQLGRQSLHLMARAMRSPAAGEAPADERDTSAPWDAFARGWHRDWESVNDSCQFSARDVSSPSPAGAHASRDDQTLVVAHEHLAFAHANLLALELRYRSLLERFDDELAPPLKDLARVLSRTQQLLPDPDHARDAVPDPDPRGANPRQAP
ncbi:hypothetical protein Hoch_3752 [Haliangium ochraceum DSM 14365]|uniref:Uncharacterized protein n=1 Tax=Haliangium ochraceum (strain DSM 14365 / JCM 11303 / SMP-2) TaxID=502025 RepID=D0LYA2_HALO1|nr:hypothetical protein Hoch_3752 [Haliangium ochraceum DSM 14365]